ncbi:MAG TPA: hypothetical protein VK536_01695 [Candidatus Limnocylindrales bacterium]|nr:hypothetical protein [Candidatus Limnocylindrales bacterium]
MSSVAMRFSFSIIFPEPQQTVKHEKAHVTRGKICAGWRTLETLGNNKRRYYLHIQGRIKYEAWIIGASLLSAGILILSLVPSPYFGSLWAFLTPIYTSWQSMLLSIGDVMIFLGLFVLFVKILQVIVNVFG